MHLTLKKETTRPAGENFLQQQDTFDAFIDRFNRERPHQGIRMKTPAELYQPSQREYRGLPELDYPWHDRTVTITTCGRICIGRQKVNVSQVFAGQSVAPRRWQTEFGWSASCTTTWDSSTMKLAASNPLQTPSRSAMCYPCLGINRNPCVRNGPK